MPELPEVEVLVRHLAPLLKGKIIRRVEVRRAKVMSTTSEKTFVRNLTGSTFVGLTRRGKYLLFELKHPRRKSSTALLGHLGMTGRMYLQPARAPIPKHAAIILDLGRANFICEDTRYFGRLTLDTRAIEQLGPEPFSEEFNSSYLQQSLARSAQAIKVKLLDQSLVAGVGNIYASEALFRAGISPRLPARRLSHLQIERLRMTVIEVLEEAIRCGSTIPLDWTGRGKRNGLFYYGHTTESESFYEERLLVYDRAGQPCSRCRTPIRRIVQAARSTYYCPHCQAR